MQDLKPLSHCKRRDFNEWAESKIALDPAFKSKILLNDEANFWLSGNVDMLSHKSKQVVTKCRKVYF